MGWVLSLLLLIILCRYFARNLHPVLRLVCCVRKTWTRDAISISIQLGNIAIVWVESFIVPQALLICLKIRAPLCITRIPWFLFYTIISLYNDLLPTIVSVLRFNCKIKRFKLIVL